MSVDIEGALSDGLDRTIRKNGLLLVGIVFVLGFLRSVVEQSLLQQIFQNFIDDLAAEASGQNQEAIESARQGLAESFPLAYLDLSPGVLSLLVLAIVVLGIVVDVGAIRTFVSDERERLPVENFTRRLPWTLGNLIVGFVLYAIIVALGTALFVLPGIYLAVALFFYNYEVVVEGENAIAALSGSWQLTSGNRLLLFVLGLVFAILNAIVVFVPSGGVPLALVADLFSAFVGVFGIAVASRAYTQLRAGGVDSGVPQPDVGGPGRGEPGRGTGQQRDDEF